MVRFAVVAYVAFACSIPCAVAEDFRIATKVRDLAVADDSNASKVVATSLSLFHHRKVYDFINTAGEVMIVEPSANKFTILSTSRSLATTVNFDEIKHLIKVGTTETQKYVQQQRQLGTSTSQQVAEALSFQLAPKFQLSADPQKQTLSLTSPHLSYTVDCTEVDSVDSVTRYLEYADWMARVNFVLHPRATYPAPRIELNKILRQKKLFPTRVELRAQVEGDINLEARHVVTWKLSAHDRDLITRWESLLKSDAVRKVPFRQYQEALLVTDRSR